ncbi:hypothetical protein [Chamaesiphon sp.]|uniref:hypothetical protein n=1 Tax=Chamaesiphon sp. TaxID=2814140 RepID=UPI003593B748
MHQFWLKRAEAGNMSFGALQSIAKVSPDLTPVARTTAPNPNRWRSLISQRKSQISVVNLSSETRDVG